MEVDIRELQGNWDLGFALHKHVLSSTFLGENEQGRAIFDTKRSDPGEAMFQLKYRSVFEKADPIAKAINDHLVPRFGEFGLIIPMAASTQRTRQPVDAIAAKLSELTGKPLFANILVKSASTSDAKPLKDMVTKSEKVAALEGRLTLNDGISTDGRWNALIVDDLFATGASMEAAVSVLRTYPKIANIFVAAVTWK